LLVKDEFRSPQSQIDIDFAVSGVGVCGNGVIEGSESCDLGPYNGFLNSGCSNVCTIVSVPEINDCVNQGGTWSLFNGDCADLCEPQKTGVVSSPSCNAVPTFSCSCGTFNGEDLCWDGNFCSFIPFCPTWALPSPDWCLGGTVIPGSVVNRCRMPPSCIPGPPINNTNTTPPLVDDDCGIPLGLLCPDGSLAPNKNLTDSVLCVWEPTGCPIIPPPTPTGGGSPNTHIPLSVLGDSNILTTSEQEVPFVCENKDYLLGLLLILSGLVYAYINRKELFKK